MLVVYCCWQFKIKTWFQNIHWTCYLLFITLNSIHFWVLCPLFVFELVIKTFNFKWELEKHFLQDELLLFYYSKTLYSRELTLRTEWLCQCADRLANDLFWIILDIKPLVRLTMNNWIERITKIRKNHIFLYALPFMTVVLLGPFVLRQFNNVRWVSVFVWFIVGIKVKT